MKRKTILVPLAFFAMALTLSSCIKDEAPNSEADITGVTLPDKGMLLRDPVVTNNDITIYANTSDSIIAPEFTVTDGATIEPASGTPRQFFTRHADVEYNEMTVRGAKPNVMRGKIMGMWRKSLWRGS